MCRQASKYIGAGMVPPLHRKSTVIPCHDTACHSTCMQTFGDMMLQHMDKSALEAADETHLSHPASWPYMRLACLALNTLHENPAKMRVNDVSMQGSYCVMPVCMWGSDMEVPAYAS